MNRLYFSIRIIPIIILLAWNNSAFAQTTFTVPNIAGVCGVSGVIVNMTGGSGGGGNFAVLGGFADGGLGGNGGIVACTLNVAAPMVITSLTYYVGMEGATGGNVYTDTIGALGGTGYGNGGNAGDFSGATGVYCVTYSESGTDVSGGGGGGSSAVLNTTGAVPLLVAGGGGGGGALASTTTGGNAGATGSPGGSYDSSYGGAGGSPGLGGAGGVGVGGAAYNGMPGESIAPGNGGNGGIGDTGSQSGGGGGAGYGGGGGGGAGNSAAEALNTVTAGGGGGSNYVCPTCLVTGLIDTAYSDTGNGYVTLALYPEVATTTGVVLCAGATSTFTETTPGGTWSSSNNDIAMVSPATGLSVTVTGISAGVANISYTEPSGYWSFVTVTIHAGVKPISGPDSVCATQSIDLYDSVGGGVFSTGTSATATVSSSGVLTGVSAGAAIVTYTLPSGCNTKDTVSVISFPGPIKGTTSICTGNTTTLTDIVTGGVWGSLDPFMVTIDPASGLLSGLYPGTTVVTYDFAGTCIVTTGVTIEQTPPAPVITSDQPLCLNQTLFLAGSDGMSGGFYSWTGPNGFASSAEKPSVVGVTYADTGTYTAIYTLTNPLVNCPSAPAKADITIDAPPVLTNITPSQTIPYGTSVQLNADNAFQYMWVPDDGTLSNPNINDPVATPALTTTYIVYGMSLYGCLDSASITITVDTALNVGIPTAFTPNNDGRNDLFRPVGSKYNHIVDFRVYNRWGQEIFQANNSERGWDGTFHGTPQDTGDYYYQIIVASPAGENVVYKGVVTLIR